MHEEMHMTQMQFMNTGAWEIVSVFKKVACFGFGVSYNKFVWSWNMGI